MHELTSSISAVTVFRRGAQIDRKVPLPAGIEGGARISGLPLSLLDHSIALRVEGPEPRPVVVDYRVGLQVNAATEQSDLDARIEQARQNIERLGARQSTLQRLRGGLQALSPLARPQSSEGAPLGAYQLDGQIELLVFRDTQTRELENQLAQVEQELRPANEAMAALRYERDQQAPAVRPEALEKALVVTLRGAPGPETTLYLNYQVPGARWAPAYSVGFSASLDKAQLTMRAMVAQKTGEDWNDVALTLSTADPNEWREIPEWKALRIGRAEEPSGARWFPPPAGTEQLFSDFDAALASNNRATKTLAPPPPPPPPCEPAPETGALYSLAKAGPQIGAELLKALDEVRAQSCPPEGGGGFLGGLASASVMPAPASAPGSSDSTLRVDRLSPEKSGFGGRARSGARGGGYAEEQMQATETTLTLDRGSLRYQSQRLAGISSAERGQLVALEQVEEYLESWSISWSKAEIFSAVHWAEHRAAQVDRGDPPAGYSFPEPQGGFDFSYQAQARVNLVSDGAFHSVPVFLTDLTPAISYVCTPRESQQVFRTASMTNPSGRALPEGPADISVGGDFLHTTPLRGVAPEGVLRLGLGVDQSVKVSRNATFKEGTSGMMGGTAELTHTITVEAVSHRSQEIVLEVRERLPQPAPEHKDELKVLLGQVKPAWESFEPDENPLLKTAYRWKLPLPPGQKVSATATYIVEMASKYELQGGNRREPRS